ncbi:protein THYLAKOID ASSEMBLY 8, chloroplastic [Eucalyptus grandis]|uniref:protein THYLAKOID ASSEMBLY 8, chloroplastic n=1 Tax=Eucalyptus grandis TaxID=71139 RepID=UPI00192E84ED|nr:protein THYLAKOID ASSEMBLY 8, chloroplastic [Eucalyptus grandis]
MNAVQTPTPLRSLPSVLPLSRPGHRPRPPQPPPPPKAMRVSMRDRSKNRKPLQRGRSLSIEAIQAVQALKRASGKGPRSLELARRSTFGRLLKRDMVEVLRELLRQSRCDLALKVFEDIRKEYWYKAQVLLYAEMFSVFAGNGLFEDVKLLYLYLRTEDNIEPHLEGFNSVLRTFISFSLVELATDCYYFMKEIGCEPDRSSFRILINGLESMGEQVASAKLREEAQKYYGDLEFLQETEEMIRQS